MRKKRRTGPVLIALVATACLVTVGVVVLVGGNEGGPPVDDPGDATPAADDPAEMLALAADRLVDEGSFAFEGTTRIEGSASEMASALTVEESTSTGRADLASVYTETTEQSDGTGYEMLVDIDGGLAWWRVSAFADRLAARPWVRGESSDRGVPAPLRDVRNWLEDATDARDGGEDENGRAVVVATLPPPLLDDIYGFTGEADEERFIDGELTTTVDDTGLPVRIEVEAGTREFGLDLDYRLDDFGVPVDVVLPSGAEIDATPTFREEDMADLDGRVPVGLSQVPAGWILVAVHVRPDADPDCAAVEVVYGSPVDSEGNYLVMWITSPDCVNEPSGGQPFTAGPYTGVVAEVPDGVTGVLLGESGVAFATSLSAGDLSLVLASLGPLDLTAVPAPLEGIPSTPT